MGGKEELWFFVWVLITYVKKFYSLGIWHFVIKTIILICSLKTRVFLLEKKCVSLDTDYCWHLCFETAWLSSTINVKSTFYVALFRAFCFAANTLVCHFTSFQIDILKKKHSKVATNKTLLVFSLYFRK